MIAVTSSNIAWPIIEWATVGAILPQLAWLWPSVLDIPLCGTVRKLLEGFQCTWFSSSIGDLSRFLAILFIPFGIPARTIFFYLFGLSNLFITRLPDECYSRNIDIYVLIIIIIQYVFNLNTKINPGGHFVPWIRGHRFEELCRIKCLYKVL
jgi:hypothetical protein